MYVQCKWCFASAIKSCGLKNPSNKDPCWEFIELSETMVIWSQFLAVISVTGSIRPTIRLSLSVYLYRTLIFFGCSSTQVSIKLWFMFYLSRSPLDFCWNLWKIRSNCFAFSSKSKISFKFQTNYVKNYVFTFIHCENLGSLRLEKELKVQAPLNLIKQKIKTKIPSSKL